MSSGLVMNPSANVSVDPSSNFVKVKSNLLFTVVDCGNLANPRNGKVDLTGTTFGSRADYTCNRGYMLDGPQSRSCRADGAWSGREPKCERKPGHPFIFQQHYVCELVILL